jgi:hypothetical protein
MRNPLGNLLVYYVAIIAPFYLILVWLPKVPGFSGWGTVLILLLYCFIYRPVIDFYRLKAKGIFKDGDFSKAFSPWNVSAHFKELYWF